jgi:Zn-dependent protease
MLRSLKIGSAFGIGIYLHWTFWLLPLYVVLAKPASDEISTQLTLVFVAAVFGCLILHELGHALMARCFGIRTRDITMYPIGGVASLERMSEKPFEEFCIAVAGPAVNVVIAVILFVPVAGVLLYDFSLVQENGLVQFLALLAIANIFLVLFNLLPAFPMDGGRVLRAVLASMIGRLHATRIAAAVAILVVVYLGMAAVGLAPLLPGEPSPMLLVVAGFVFIAGQRELQIVEMQEKLRAQPPVEVLPVVRPVVAPSLQPWVYQPLVTVYTWDKVNNNWVKET